MPPLFLVIFNNLDLNLHLTLRIPRPKRLGEYPADLYATAPVRRERKLNAVRPDLLSVGKRQKKKEKKKKKKKSMCEIHDRQIPIRPRMSRG